MIGSCACHSCSLLLVFQEEPPVSLSMKTKWYAHCLSLKGFLNFHSTSIELIVPAVNYPYSHFKQSSFSGEIV